MQDKRKIEKQVKLGDNAELKRETQNDLEGKTDRETGSQKSNGETVHTRRQKHRVAD